MTMLTCPRCPDLASEISGATSIPADTINTDPAKHLPLGCPRAFASAARPKLREEDLRRDVAEHGPRQNRARNAGREARAMVAPEDGNTLS